ncbi:fatty acid synthase-like [Physella acuta]|uniref:fatty acid synthase-like n=1 Tax=Physella acuta TaxID=109671 RepID=UPI0027DD9ED5|nr:fatty acid synthase-like [Physella acuta]
MASNTKNLAIISGVGLRLPQANNLDELAQLLLNKGCFTEYQWHRVQSNLYGQNICHGIVDPMGMMDCDFFNIPPEEAVMCNPMLGPLLEVVAESILDSGLKLSDVSKHCTGFYLGATFCDTDVMVSNLETSSNSFNTRTELSARVSHHFDLKGPVIQFDGACASSFAALHAAMLDIQANRCEIAIVAGANLVLDPMVSVQFSKLNMLSPTGLSAPFDESANGYVRTDGIVAILLKSDASHISSRTYCSVVGFGLKSQGANGNGILRPSKHFQSELLEEVYEKFNINVEDVVFLESHGTSTQIGDKTELGAIYKAVCSKRTKPIIVGSIKGNIGHTEACSGLAGILKCLASYRTNTIFSNVNYRIPNSAIPALHTGDIIVPVTSVPLPQDGANLMCVSCFGFGGLGGHIVLKPAGHVISGDLVPPPMLIPLNLPLDVDIQTVEDSIRKEITNPAFYQYLLHSEMCSGYVNYQRTYVIVQPESGRFEMCSGYVNYQRTYVIVQPESATLTYPTCVASAMPKKKIHLVLTDFLSQAWTPRKSILNLQPVATSLALSQQVYQAIDHEHGDLIGSLKSDAAPLVQEPVGFVLRVACQIGVIDLLSELGVLEQVDAIEGPGVGALAAAYADQCLTRGQCIRLADVMERVLLEENHSHKGQVN